MTSIAPLDRLRSPTVDECVDEPSEDSGRRRGVLTPCGSSLLLLGVGFGATADEDAGISAGGTAGAGAGRSTRATDSSGPFLAGFGTPTGDSCVAGPMPGGDPDSAIPLVGECETNAGGGSVDRLALDYNLRAGDSTVLYFSTSSSDGTGVGVSVQDRDSCGVAISVCNVCTAVTGDVEYVR
jgi:hypothetical protein